MDVYNMHLQQINVHHASLNYSTHLLNLLSPYCCSILKSVLYSTSDNQFGFKSEQSTDTCMHLPKETIDYYKCHNTTLFISFIDGSNVFVQINHWWYSMQLMKVRWSDHVILNHFM